MAVCYSRYLILTGLEIREDHEAVLLFMCIFMPYSETDISAYEAVLLFMCIFMPYSETDVNALEFDNDYRLCYSLDFDVLF